MSDIVAEGDSLNKVEVKVQRGADGACDTGHKLHMEGAAGDIIILIEREHLGFIGVSVVIGGVHYFLHIPKITASPKRRCIVAWISSDCSVFQDVAPFKILTDFFLQLLGQRMIDIHKKFLSCGNDFSILSYQKRFVNLKRGKGGEKPIKNTKKMG